MKEQLKAIRADIDVALAAVAKKHRLTSIVCAGSMKYGTGRFEVKIEGLATGGKTVEAERYEKNAAVLKLMPLGSSIEYCGKTYTSVGLSSTGAKVFVRQAVTDKEYLMPVGLFKVKS